MFFGYLEKLLQEVFVGEESQADCKLERSLNCYGFLLVADRLQRLCFENVVLRHYCILV